MTTNYLVGKTEGGVGRGGKCEDGQTAREEEEGSLKGAKQQVERLMTGGNKNRNKGKSTNFSQPSAIAHRLDH